LACPCEYLNVIKFLVIHSNTMEAYTLWWNGATFWKMLDYNTKFPPLLDNRMLLWERGPNMERQRQLVIFRWNCVKLAWASIYEHHECSNIYHNRILHVNDLSKNIMLDFLSNNPDVVYTSVCDWNDFEHLQKVTTFLYGFSKEQDAINTRKACSRVAPKIFFVQDELRTMNFFWRMAKQH
jgi:hypothetical protein